MALLLVGALLLGNNTVGAETSEDLIPPEEPILSELVNTSTSLIIKGEPGTKAEITIEPQIYTTTIKDYNLSRRLPHRHYERMIQENGEAIFRMSPQGSGTRIFVRLVDGNGNESETVTANVHRDQSTLPVAPVIKPLTSTSRYIYVLGTPGDYVRVEGWYLPFYGQFDENGVFRREVDRLFRGLKFYATSYTRLGSHSQTVYRSVYRDRYAPKPGQITQSVTANSQTVYGKGEPYAWADVTIGSETYIGPVGADGKFAVKIPPQKMGQKMTLVIRDTAENKSEPRTITVQHELYHKFHRRYFDGMKLTLHKEVFRASGDTRYDATFVPLFLGHPSKANMNFLLNYYSEEGNVTGFEKITLRVGRASYTERIVTDEVGVEAYDDGAMEESYVFKPTAKLIRFIDQYVQPTNRIVVKVEGANGDLEFKLAGAEKRAFIESLQYVGY